MAHNPDHYGGGEEAWDLPPQPEVEDFSDYWLDLLEGYEGLEWPDFGDFRPDSFLGMLSQQIPIENIIGFAKNQISGKNVAPRVEKYRELGLGQVNRAFSSYYDVERGREAAQGGRGSSFGARKRAEGRGALGGARAGVESKALEYEDVLRDAGFSKGMNVLGALQGAQRGDESAMLNYGNMLIQSMYPQLAALGGQADIIQMLQSGDMSMAEFQYLMDQAEWEMRHGGPDEPKIDINSPWGGLGF